MLDLPEFLTHPDPSIYLGDNYVVVDFETTNIQYGNPVYEANELVLACWYSPRFNRQSLFPAITFSAIRVQNVRVVRRSRPHLYNHPSSNLALCATIKSAASQSATSSACSNSPPTHSFRPKVGEYQQANRNWLQL